MIANSKNDHLNFGFTEEFNEVSSHDIFHIGLGDLSRAPKTFFEECQTSALDIKSRFGQKKIYVCLSGGIDSECVLRSFVSCGINVSAAILSFTNDLNWHDVDPAKKLCQELSVPYEEISLDVLKLLNSDFHLQCANQFQLSSPMIATHLWLAEYVGKKLGGVPVFAGDFARILRPNNETIRSLANNTPILIRNYYECIPQWRFSSLANQDHFVLELLFRSHNLPGISNFYLYSPEVIAAAIANGFSPDFLRQESKILKLIVDLPSGRPSSFYEAQVSTNKKKELFFKSGGFIANMHPSKWTGFELIHDVYGSKTEVVGTALRPDDRFDEKIYGMTLFNEKYREPMRKVAKQNLLKKILMKPTLYKFIESSLVQV